MTWTNTIGFIGLQGSPMIATDSPRQCAVMLSAAKHLRLLFSRLRHNPNPPQILPSNAPSCRAQRSISACSCHHSGAIQIRHSISPLTHCHAERSEASAVALVSPTHLTTWCDFPCTSLWHLAVNFGAASFDSLGPRATTESSDVSGPTRP